MYLLFISLNLDIPILAAVEARDLVHVVEGPLDDDDFDVLARIIFLLRGLSVCGDGREGGADDRDA